jgi:two-component system KDP operon response regulator KdpE
MALTTEILAPKHYEYAVDSPWKRERSWRGIACATSRDVLDAKKKILVVDSDGDWRDLVTLVIARSGYEAIEASTATEAIEKAMVVHPDLILMDPGLTGMSGDDLMAQLKTVPYTAEIPVVVQTKFLPCRTTNAAAKEILPKPFDLTALPAILRKYL